MKLGIVNESDGHETRVAMTPDVAAKLIKKQLSGDLNAGVDSQPPFPYKERHLLRAQLARIQHAT